MTTRECEPAANDIVFVLDRALDDGLLFNVCTFYLAEEHDTFSGRIAHVK